MQTRSQTRALNEVVATSTPVAKKNQKINLVIDARQDVQQELNELRTQNEQLKGCLAEIVTILVENKNAISRSF